MEQLLQISTLLSPLPSFIFLDYLGSLLLILKWCDGRFSVWWQMWSYFLLQSLVLCRWSLQVNWSCYFMICLDDLFTWTGDAATAFIMVAYVVGRWEILFYHMLPSCSGYCESLLMLYYSSMRYHHLVLPNDLLIDYTILQKPLLLLCSTWNYVFHQVFLLKYENRSPWNWTSIIGANGCHWTIVVVPVMLLRISWHLH